MAFVLWFGSYAYLYVYSAGGPKPLYSYLCLLTFFIIVSIYSGVYQNINRPSLSLLNGWLVIYLMYGVFEFINSTQDSVALQSLITLGESVVLVLVFSVLIAVPELLARVERAFAYMAVFGASVNIYDFVNPTFSNVPGRAAGLYVNPNISGHFISMAMVGGISIVPRRWRVPYLLVCSIGVLVTFSRASWIIWIIGIVWLIGAGEVGVGGRSALKRVAIIFLGIVMASLLFGGFVGSYVATTPAAKYLDANTQARLGIGSSSLSDFAAREREYLVSASFGEAASAPLIGHGLGYTSEWRYQVGPHNMYLLFLVEGGVLGACLYVALMVLLWLCSSGVGRLLSLQMIVAGVFTHNQLGQPAFLIILAFTVAHGAVVCKRQRREPGQAHGILI